MKGEVPCEINLVAEVDGLSLFLLAYKLVYYTESTRKLYVLAMDLKAEKVVSAAGFAWLQRATIRNPTSAETVKAGALTQDTECGVIHLPTYAWGLTCDRDLEPEPSRNTGSSERPASFEEKKDCDRE